MDKDLIIKKIQRLKHSLPGVIQATLEQNSLSNRSSQAVPTSLANFIDHTYLKPDCSTQTIYKVCQQAETYGFYSVCIPSSFLELAKSYLDNTNVKLCTVIGFPHGNSSTEAKVAEAKAALLLYADEVDMVQNNGFLFSNRLENMFQDIASVKHALGNKILKVILETSQLNEDQIILSCWIAKAAGADFVKTSTGFVGDGAKPEHIFIMRQTVGNSMGVKASGGIRNSQQAQEMIAAGASRLGCSSSVEIVTGLEAKGTY